MQTLGLEKAAELLHMHPDTVRERAASGEIPASKLGRAWVFIDVDLLAYIREQYGKSKDKKCRSTNKTTQKSGTSRSRSMGRGLEEALALPTRS